MAKNVPLSRMSCRPLDETFQGNEKKRRFLFAFQNLLLSLQPQTTKRSFLCHGVDWI